MQIGINILAYFGEVQVCMNVIAAAAQVSIGSQHVLQSLLLAHDLLRALRIGPQVRIRRLLVNFG